jgi:hypothetical protein
MTNTNSDSNMTDVTNSEIKKKKSNPNGIIVLQYIQQQVKEMKEQNPNLKHRVAIALVSEQYRKQNGTIKRNKTSAKCKCKKCKTSI